MKITARALLRAASVALCIQVGAAQAQVLTLNCTQYANSDVPANCPTATVTPTTLSTPGAYAYGNASLQPAGSTGGIITGSTYPSGYTGASFYDAFVIQISNSLGDSISSTINFGSNFQITNFQERLYSYTGTAPTVGAVPSALDFWTAPLGNSGTVAVLPSTFLAQGTYVLEVRGDVTGTTGGAYIGGFQLSPVPLPAAGWLLATGLSGLLGFARRRPHG